MKIELTEKEFEILKILIYKIKTYQKNNSKTELIYFRVIQIFNVLYKY